MNYNTKKQKFKHFNKNDRLRLETLYNQGYKVSAVAEILGYCRATIYNELKRGYYDKLHTDLTYKKVYSAEIAQQDYDYKATNKGAPLKIANDYAFSEYLEQQVLKGFSPDIVLGRLRLKGSPFQITICTTTFYSYIDKQVFFQLSNKDLLIKSKKPKRKYNKIQKVVRCAEAPRVTQRAEYIENRSEFGHWEMDTVIGQRSSPSCLLVLTERLSRQELIFKMKDKTQKSVVSVLNRLERKHKADFKNLFKTITVDNGTEFLAYQQMKKSVYSKKPRTEIYYCNPYSSWERGTNENLNKQIRRYIPKGFDIANYDDTQIKNIENIINNYPRRILGYLTSNEIYETFAC